MYVCMNVRTLCSPETGIEQKTVPGTAEALVSRPQSQSAILILSCQVLSIHISVHWYAGTLALLQTGALSVLYT